MAKRKINFTKKRQQGAAIEARKVLPTDKATETFNKNTNRNDPVGKINPIENNVKRATRKDMDTALAWFFSEIKGELGADGRSKSRIRRIPDKAFNPAKDPFIGGVFFYIYDAKWKDELPYWDQFPLVIPISLYDNGFLGLNLHYLPPIGRARLLDILLRFKRRALTSKAYMRLSYEVLKKTVNLDLFMPCVHRYLTGHIKSNLVKVSDEYWERAAMLPVQKFTGATSQEVWRDSARKIRRKRLKKK